MMKKMIPIFALITVLPTMYNHPSATETRRVFMLSKLKEVEAETPHLLTPLR